MISDAGQATLKARNNSSFTVTLSDSALTRMRIVPHVLWDVLSSVCLLACGRTLPLYPYRSWAREATALLSANQELVLLDWAARWPSPRVPRFLLFPPDQGCRDLAGALRQLQETPPDLLGARLREEYPSGVPAAFVDFLTDPCRVVADLATAVQSYYQIALHPHWPVIGVTVEEDVVRRAQALAAGGVDDLLGDLHARIRWSRPTLSVTASDSRLEGLAAKGLVLVPLLFAREQVVASVADSGEVLLGYQARGAAGLAMSFDRAEDLDTDRMALLLGRSRAAVVRSLVSPQTTTALAHRLGLAPSTVSEHLAVLVSSRVASRQRRGGKVYYGLSGSGTDLIRAFTDP